MLKPSSAHGFSAFDSLQLRASSNPYNNQKVWLIEKLERTRIPFMLDMAQLTIPTELKSPLKYVVLNTPHTIARFTKKKLNPRSRDHAIHYHHVHQSVGIS